MLWTKVYEFFVKYIFGGNYYGTGYYGYLGDAYYSIDGNFTDDGFDTSNLCVKAFNSPFFTAEGALIGGPYMPLGNYLSLIATIISMVAIVLICCALIKKIYNMCAHIIG